MKKLHFASIFSAFVMVLIASGAKAYDVNYSHINPAADRTIYSQTFCPLDGNDIGPVTGTNVVIGSKKIGCREACDEDGDGVKDDTCCDCNNTVKTKAAVQYQYQRYNDFFTTNMCYRPSCYYQAMAYTDLNYVVQPLNKHARIVQEIIGSYATDGRLTRETGVHGIASDRGVSPMHDNLVTHDEYKKRYSHKNPDPGPNQDHRHYQNGKYNTSNAKLDEIVASPAEIRKYEPGGGTSAFQGLLWSWRMLSNKWQGKWANQSFYESQGLFPDGQADRVTNLPSAELSKHIIIISDGLDNDGLDNFGVISSDNIGYQSGYVIPKATDDAVYQASRTDSGFGFEFNPQNALPAKPTGETCDAHAAEASITVEDYVNICEEMTTQGITVYAIVFDDAVNEKLKRCVLATERGVYIDNVNICSASVTDSTKCQSNPTGVASPQFLREALTKVFATIAAQSVRLVE